MRPEALDALRGVDRIIHAGDVGTGDIVEQLEQIAPVVVVRGNVDVEELPLTASVEFGGRKIFVIHIREELQFDPKAAGYSAVIFGHTHKPLIEERNGVLYLNPGSAGPRRFDLKPSVALLKADAKGLHAKIVPLRITGTAS
jgi:putative phosphoesterase